MTLYFVQCVKEGRTVWRILAQNPMELGARLGKPCNKILRNLIHVHKYVLAYACVYVARCQRMLQALRYWCCWICLYVIYKGQHVSAYMPIMFSVHYSITKPIFFLLHLSFHLIKNTQSIKRLKLEPLPLTPVSTVSVSAILSCRSFFILIFLPCIKMNHYGFSRKGGWKDNDGMPLHHRNTHRQGVLTVNERRREKRIKTNAEVRSL